MKEWGIKAKVLFLTLVPTVTISILLGTYFTTTRLNDLEQALRDRGYAIALRLAPASEHSVFADNKVSLQKIANHAMEEPEVKAISIFNKDGDLLAHAGATLDAPIHSVNSWSQDIIMSDTGDSLRFTVPVTLRDSNTHLQDLGSPGSSLNYVKNAENNILGWIEVEIARTNTELQQYQVIFACIIIVMIGLATSGAFAYRMGQDVTKPILEITSAVEKIKNGKLDTRIYTGAHCELKLLESGINTMAETLKKAHEEMQHSIEQATADLRQTLETIEIQNVELQMARKEAEKASKVKSEFLANISHEIRTPLNGIIGFINLLLKTQPNHKQKDYLNTIQKSSDHLLSIINDILDFSKIEAGKLHIDSVSMSLRVCIEETLDFLAPSSHDKNLELNSMIYSDVPEYIISDPIRLKQILTNLISNAIKFTNEGNVNVRVMLEKDSIDTAIIRISVTDTGIGLTAKQKNSLFEAFEQADTSTTRKYGGTGLGLVISKKLSNDMGGDIGVESEANKGSTFWFSFEAGKINETIVDKNEITLEPDLPVLIFDENSASKLSLRHALNSANCIVTEAENIDYKTIENNLKAMHARIFILALQKNKIDYQVISDITSLCNSYNCKIVFMTNSNDHTITQKLLDIDVTACISKPFMRRKLLSTLNFTLESHKHTNENETINKDKIQHSSQQHNIKVLAVDDNPANLKLVEALLEDLNLIVITAKNGKEAVKLTQKESFDLILMDIQMPEMDGIEATKYIRSNNFINNKTPIIALTAYAMLTEKQQLLLIGMNGYLIKPLKEEELLTTIERWTNYLEYEAELIDVEALELPKRYENNILEFPGNKKTTSTNKFKSKKKNLDKKKDSILDWDECLNLANNKEDIALKMLDTLKEELPEYKLKVNKSIMLLEGFIDRKINDESNTKISKLCKKLREPIHRLHGGCCYLGVKELRLSAKNLEVACIKYDAATNKVEQLNNVIKLCYKLLSNINKIGVELKEIKQPS